jgi:transcriptional regulator with XRE-family HTH domain
MRVPSFMQQIRHGADLSLAEVRDLTGIDRGTLSRIERGRQLPADSEIAALELAYGPAAQWYPPELLLLIQRDRDDEQVAA